MTHFNALHVGTMIQIRNVPETLHSRLKSRAALAGMSLSDHLLGELRQVAERPTLDELGPRGGDQRTEGSRVGVFLFGEVRVFHRPHPSPDADKGAVASIRRWLDEHGVKP